MVSKIVKKIINKFKNINLENSFIYLIKISFFKKIKIIEIKNSNDWYIGILYNKKLKKYVFGVSEVA